MVAAVYKVEYSFRRKKFSGQLFSDKREISMDDEIYKKNYNNAQLTNFFKQSVAVYHADLQEFETFRFYKISDKNSGTGNYGNYSNPWDISIGGNKDKQEPSKKTKPSKSIWRSPTWMIPFRIVWYLIKKIFGIAMWILEEKKH